MRSVPAASEVPEPTPKDSSFFDEPRLCAELIRVLRQEGTLRLRVRGSSMWPWVQSGTEVRICASSSEAVRRGDLVLFQRGATGLTLHRAVRRAEDGCGWIARGDAYGSVEELVPSGSILGRGEGLVIGRRTLSLGPALERRVGAAILDYGPVVARVAKFGMRVRRRVLDGSWR